MSDPAEDMWRLVERAYVPSDFWCHTHHRWVSIQCGQECERVGVYLRRAGVTRPALANGADFATGIFACPLCSSKVISEDIGTHAEECSGRSTP